MCIVFEQRWPNQGVMQTIAEETRKRERASLSKEEGGTVVKKNLYPPPASLFAPTQGCKTLPVMQHVKTHSAGSLPASARQPEVHRHHLDERGSGKRGKVPAAGGGPGGFRG